MSRPRVLVVRVGAMGDVLHALPAVAGLRRVWPEAIIDWVVDPRWAPLLINENGCGPVVSGLHLAHTRLWSKDPLSGTTVRSIASLRKALRAGSYDHVVDLQGTIRSAVLGWFAGGRRLAGFADPREAAAALLYRRRLPRRGDHVVEQGAALLGDALGVALEPQAPRLPEASAAGGWAAEVLRSLGGGKRVALLAPTAGWGAKQWPVERFAKLARGLADEGWAVLVNAGRNGDPVCAAVVEASGHAAKGVWSGIAELVALTRRVDVVVGADSGPVHLGAALGTPVVALFGPTDPVRNGPWGPGGKVVLRDSTSVTSYKRIAAVESGLGRIGERAVMDAVTEVAGS